MVKRCSFRLSSLLRSSPLFSPRPGAHAKPARVASVHSRGVVRLLRLRRLAIHLPAAHHHRANQAAATAITRARSPSARRLGLTAAIAFGPRGSCRLQILRLFHRPGRRAARPHRPWRAAGVAAHRAACWRVLLHVSGHLIRDRRLQGADARLPARWITPSTHLSFRTWWPGRSCGRVSSFRNSTARVIRPGSGPAVRAAHRRRCGSTATSPGTRTWR
jgi:hypothetical protein